MRLLIGVLFLMGSVAFATHRADHRFTVSGYVRDEAGNPKKGMAVLLEHKTGQKFRELTGEGGYFQALFHLHDENVGDEISVTVGNEIKKVILSFDPKDLLNDRHGEVSFGAEPGSSAWVYWGGAVAVTGILGYFALRKKVALRKKMGATRLMPRKRREVKS